MPAYLAVSSGRLLPFKPDEHHHTTVNHKLFQYMYMRCPVLASACNPLVRIITEAGCGRVMKGAVDDPRIFAENVIALLQDHNLRNDMGLRGHEAVLAKYLWTDDGDRLAELYNRLEAS
ncbi:MAG: glycosyltransferase, partial [Desulfosarcina sp.]|nr:glycosyltransferase [Desulfobacterales bacterium]